MNIHFRCKYVTNHNTQQHKKTITMTFPMSDMNGNGTKVIIEDDVRYFHKIFMCLMLLLQEECDDEGQQLTLKEIEEQKRKEKEQQQKKVLCSFS